MYRREVYGGTLDCTDKTHVDHYKMKTINSLIDKKIKDNVTLAVLPLLNT